MASWFDDHWYKVKKDGVDHYIASVTTKLDVEAKPFLGRWRGDIGNREADLRVYESGMRGKRIHHALQTYLLGGIVLYNPWESPIYTDAQIEDMRQSVNGVLVVLKDQGEMLDVWKLERFFEIVNPKVVETEKIVYSIDHDIAGTLDIAMIIEAGTYAVNGAKSLVIPETGRYVADLKTGKVVDESVFRQLAPYCFAYEDMGLGRPVGALILHTGATTRGGIPGFATKVCMREDLKPWLDDYHHLAAIWKRNNPTAGPTVFSFPSKIQRRIA